MAKMKPSPVADEKIPKRMPKGALDGPVDLPTGAVIIPDAPSQSWQCDICGGATDLLVCPIDGNAAPGAKLNG